MAYSCASELDTPLYKTEGFESQEEMDDWFKKLVQQGETIEQFLMKFHTIES